MSRLTESEPHLESPPPRTPGPDARLREVARELPAFLIELRHSERGEFRFDFIGEGIQAVLPIEADEATADPARLLSMIHPEDLDRLRAAMTRAARERAPLHDEFRVCPAPDRAVWLAIHAHCTPQADGAQRWQGWLADVTERRLAQAALADSALHHRKLFDGNPIPMWVHDRLTLGFLTVNDAAVATYGWSREQFLSMTLVDLRHPGPDGSDPGDAPSQDGGVRPANAHHRLRDGSLIEVELSSQPLTWNGRPARVVMALDVTARRRAEAEIQRPPTTTP